MDISTRVSQAPEARAKVARGPQRGSPAGVPGRGKRLSAQPLEICRTCLALRRCAQISRRDQILPNTVFCRPFQGSLVYQQVPGAARSGTCPWLPSAAPPALTDSLFHSRNRNRSKLFDTFATFIRERTKRLFRLTVSEVR